MKFGEAKYPGIKLDRKLYRRPFTIYTLLSDRYNSKVAHPTELRDSTSLIIYKWLNIIMRLRLQAAPIRISWINLRFRGVGRWILLPFDRSKLVVSPCFQSL